MSDEVAVIKRPSVELGTIAGSTPAEIVRAATVAAKELARVIDSAGLAVQIQGRRYVRCEGWTTLAAMLGCVPREVEVYEMEQGARYVASVELIRMADGIVLCKASAECGNDERRWAKMPRYAKRSMAVTRATGKACRIALSWIVTLAGYEPTPAEEITAEIVSEQAAQRPAANGNGPRVISEAQVKRLWARVKAAALDAMPNDKTTAVKLSQDAVRSVLEDNSLESTSQIPRDSYDELLTEAEDRARVLCQEALEGRQHE